MTTLFGKAIVFSTLTTTATIYAASKYSENLEFIKPITLLNDTPPVFQRIVKTPRRSTQWGLWSRPITQKHASLEAISQALFGSTAYKLELLLSNAKEKASAFKQTPGSKLGNMVVLLRPSEDEVIYEYKAEPDFDFIMYLGIDRCEHECRVNLGFVDWSDSQVQHLGERVYTPLLLDSAARGLK
ncbi:hypothetical protein SmJEL517_g02727 [Synchytrium microbalum]|uniref:Uncharacterized protein n=1 Tax=Synchytrium microbalum TaxID=1806994 RepID=A0A507C6C2_9FUNG|nr:uncharacterized protein SmJEL517_g02727 [Synchytrium microbalum]TPX34659.1 hypothetical protein SmJEL517_g02727 [Synchytrium microbalum]